MIEIYTTGALQLLTMGFFLAGAARTDIPPGARLIAAGLLCGVASRFVALLL